MHRPNLLTLSQILPWNAPSRSSRGGLRCPSARHPRLRPRRCHRWLERPLPALHLGRAGGPVTRQNNGKKLRVRDTRA